MSYTAAWRSLLPWMDDDELRQLLDERGAWMVGERLRGVGVPVRVEGAPIDLVAQVLAEIHGDPMRLMEGEPFASKGAMGATRPARSSALGSKRDLP